MIGLSCSSLSCDGFGDNKFVKSLEVLPRIGYKFIELNCWHPSDLMPSNITNMRRRCREAGIVPSAVYGSSFGGEGFDISKDVCHKLRMIDSAVELGCHRIVATGAARGEKGGMDTIERVLNHVLPYAEQRGVLVCLENHANNNLETIADFEFLFQRFDSANIGLCVDTGHFDASGIDLNDVVKSLHRRINHIHVKEAEKRGIERFVRFGEGVTDNIQVIERMIQFGYSGYISVELAVQDKNQIEKDLRKPYELFKKYESS